MMKRLIGILCCIFIGTGCLLAQTPKADNAPKERIIPIHDLLRYPLGMKDLKWSESASKQKKKIEAEYGNFNTYSKYRIVKTIGYCYKSPIKADYDCDHSWMIYNFTGYSWQSTYSLAYQILEDLRAYGFELLDLRLNDKNDRYITSTAGYINNIQYRLIMLECAPNWVRLRVDTDKKKSKN